MRIIRAEAMGMCFGVRAALRIADSIADPSRVTIHGELVHNPAILEDLRGRGFRLQSEPERDRPPATAEVMITAHGISSRREAELRGAGHRLIDTTCPLVRHIHETARLLERQGWFVIIIGREDHVEVRGLTEDLPAHAVVLRPQDVRAYDAPKLGVICQSTTAPWQAELVLAEIRRLNPDCEIRYEPTICRPTLERQLAMHRLLSEVQAVIVVGGRHSNNTLELARLAQSRGVPCLHVQQEVQLDEAWLDRFEIIGLTAGTSTPDAVIEAVHRRLMIIAARREAECRPA